MTPLNRPSLGSWMGYPTELINLDGRSISRNIADKNVAATLILVPLASLVENPTLLKHFVLLYKDGKAVPNVKELAM